MERNPETVEESSPWTSPVSSVNSQHGQQLPTSKPQDTSGGEEQRLNKEIAQVEHTEQQEHSEQLTQKLAQVLEQQSKPKAQSERQPKGKTREAFSGYDSDDLYNASPIASAKGLTDEPLGQQSQIVLGQLVDISTGEEKDYEQSKTLSKTALSGYASNSPMRHDNCKQDKETDQAREPSPESSSNGSDQTAFRRPPSQSNKANVPAADKKGPSRPVSPENGQETSTSSFTSIWTPQVHINPQAPIFCPMDDGSFAPFIEKAAPIPGEHMADTMIRDQIRRCELQLERPLTDQQKEVIRSFYNDMRQRRAPDEPSIPSTVYSSVTGQPINPAQPNPSSAGPRTNANGGGNTAPPAAAARPRLPWHSTPPTADVSMVEHYHGIAYTLERKVEALEKELKEVTDLRTADRMLLNTTVKEVGQLYQQKQVIEQRLATAVSGVVPAKSDIEKLKGDGGGGRPGGFTLTTLVIAMVVLVWLVTEAMLHSKRLSDGFGPYINGGFNGLGSVLIFGSWFKFLMFNAVALYLGYFSVKGVKGVVN